MNRNKRKKKGAKRSKFQLKELWQKYWKEKSPIFKFFLAFIVGIGLFYWIYTLPYFVNTFFIPFTNWQASVASSLLNILGESTTTSSGSLSNSNITLNIQIGCDGAEPIAFYLIGVLLVPFPWKTKIPGFLAGITLLLLLNIVRIAGLYFTKIYWPKGFDFLHLHGGFTVFFLMMILIWLIWANWAIKKMQTPKHA